MSRRIASIAFVLGLLAFAGCSKSTEKGSEGGASAGAEEELPEEKRSQVEGQPTNPHGGAMKNPHQGGAPANPHGGGGGMGGMAGAGGAAEVSEDGTVALGPITMKAPGDWSSQEPKSRMRAAQFEIPGDAGAAELVIYYFGAKGAGGVEANLERWYGQFQKPDGSAVTAEDAERKEREVNGVEVITVDVSGRYVARMRPGAAKRNDKPDHRMLAAIVQTDKGPYYLKLIGPDGTVAAAKKGFDEMIASIEPTS